MLCSMNSARIVDITTRYTPTITAILCHVSIMLADVMVSFQGFTLLQLTFLLENVKDYMGDVMTICQFLPDRLANTFQLNYFIFSSYLI